MSEHRATPDLPPAGAARGLTQKMRAQLRVLMTAHLAPSALFWTIWVGAVVGCSPLYGLHLSLCVLLGWLLRLNVPVMYAAANISIPPLAPLLGFASVQLGERALRGRWLPLHRQDFQALASAPGGVPALMARFFVDWLLGGLIVGGAIGAVLGGAVFLVTRVRAARAQAAGAPSPSEGAIRAALVEASRRFRAAPPRVRWYAFFKYRLDPSYRRIAELVPEDGLTVDLGTGLGMLPLVLALLPGRRSVVGVEWDREKAAEGRLAAAGLPRIELLEGDARDFALPACDAITIVDVLHYYEAAAQRALLRRAAEALRPGGLLLVRDGDGRQGSGAAFTRWLEALSLRIGWNRGLGPTHFRAASDLRAEMEALGLSVATELLSGPLHPGNVLLRARKPAPAAALDATPT